MDNMDYKLAFIAVLLSFLGQKSHGFSVEYMQGAINAEHNRVYVQQLNGTTPGTTHGKYSTITWSYHVRSRYNSSSKDSNPFLYFRHEEKEVGYRITTTAGCFSHTLNSGLDPRLVPLIPFDKTEGIDKECVLENATFLNCYGRLRIAVGFKTRFYVSVGYLCGSESALTLTYNINVTEIADSSVPCANWSNHLDKLQDPVPFGFREWINSCTRYYGKFSQWNVAGLSEDDTKYIYMMANKILDLSCYKHLNEGVCRVLFPECSNGTVILPCKETCIDFKRGCNDVLDSPAKFDFTCSSLEYKRHSYKKCNYQQIQCTSSPSVPKWGYTISQNGSEAESVAQISCFPFLYQLKGDPHISCGFDGEWHVQGEGCECEFLTGRAVLLVGAVTLVATVIAGIFIYRFRFELQLLTYKYCPCWLCVFCCCRKKHNTNKLYHAFVMYEHNMNNFVKKEIHEPLIALGYKIAVDYDTFMFNDNLLHKIPEVISQSSRIIMVLNQDFLDSEWCRYELDQAIMHTLEDASLSFLIILMQDKNTLQNVPRWLRGYIRTHIYIEKTHPMFFRKLLLALPEKELSETARNLPDAKIGYKDDGQENVHLIIQNDNSNTEHDLKTLVQDNGKLNFIVRNKATEPDFSDISDSGYSDNRDHDINASVSVIPNESLLRKIERHHRTADSSEWHEQF